MSFLRTLILALLVFVPAFSFAFNPTVEIIQINPNRPVVINADYNYQTQDGHVVTLPHPWFTFTFVVANHSGQTLTIATMDASTSVFSTPTNWDFNFNETDGTYDIIVPPHSNSGPITMYIAGLPAPAASTFEYDFTLEFDGWYGSPAGPQGRFHQVIPFVTQ